MARGCGALAVTASDTGERIRFGGIMTEKRSKHYLPEEEYEVILEGEPVWRPSLFDYAQHIQLSFDEQVDEHGRLEGLCVVIFEVYDDQLNLSLMPRCPRCIKHWRRYQARKDEGAYGRLRRKYYVAGRWWWPGRSGPVNTQYIPEYTYEDWENA
jgi:hypothetical protein